MDLAFFEPAVHRARRTRLAAALGERPALFVAGAPVPRNYAGNPYPFRAASHFLYFVGLPLPDAMVLCEGERCVLFTHEPTADDALWHGPVPSLAELAERTGCEVEPLAKLPDALAGRTVATLPAPDLGTRLRQEALLGRSIGADADEGDAALADAVIALRLVHDEGAQRALARAAEATAAAHAAGMAATRPGLHEHDVRAAMERALFARGCGTSYGSIVTTHGEVLHNEEYHHRLEDGDLLLCDVGAETPDGWAGDVTRTWPVSGHFTGAQRDVYEVVLRGQRAGIEAVRPGARYRDVHLVAARTMTAGLVELGLLRGDPDELVADGVHALFFPHGVGHLLGLDVHDMEDLGDRAGYAPGRTRSDRFGLCYLRLDRDLAPGMAVTIEPGFYQVPAILDDPERTAVAGDRLVREALPRFAGVRGIRIEDDVLVTETGRSVLTAPIPKDPGEVEAALGA